MVKGFKNLSIRAKDMEKLTKVCKLLETPKARIIGDFIQNLYHAYLSFRKERDVSLRYKISFEDEAILIKIFGLPLIGFSGCGSEEAMKQALKEHAEGA